MKSKTSREQMQFATFQRDHFKCVFCGEDAVDAHHLLERSLWRDGSDGYLLDNLISVCSPCHVLCEQTVLSVADGRAAAGIELVCVPDHLYDDVRYDKWANVLLDDGSILMGELFDRSYKHLKAANKLQYVKQYVKYPRTYHLPWSNPNRDDRTLRTLAQFEGKQIVVTEKLDGECTSIYNDYLHARSVDGASHKWQGWVRNFAAHWQHELWYGGRVCGENVYARHSIKYDDLSTYFYGFSVWDKLRCLSWDDTLEWFDILGVEPVPTLYEGVWDEERIRHIHLNEQEKEGYVVRVRDSFSYSDFSSLVGKYVRPQHVQTHERWDYHAIERNGLIARMDR